MIVGQQTHGSTQHFIDECVGWRSGGLDHLSGSICSSWRCILYKSQKSKLNTVKYTLQTFLRVVCNITGFVEAIPKRWWEVAAYPNLFKVNGQFRDTLLNRFPKL